MSSEGWSRLEALVYVWLLGAVLCQACSGPVFDESDSSSWWSNQDISDLGYCGEDTAPGSDAACCRPPLDAEVTHRELLDDPLALRNHLISAIPTHPVPSAAAAFSEFQKQKTAILEKALGYDLAEKAGTVVSSETLGVLAREGYSVEKLLLEPVAGVQVPALLLRPAPMPEGLLPGVVVLHGHDQPGKTFTPILTLATNLAIRGAVVLVPDWFGFGDLSGDSWKHINAQGNMLAGVTMNYPISVVARRYVDFMLGLPEVDPRKVAATGHSGGGENTLYLGAIDHRLRACAIIDGMDDWAFRLEAGLSRCAEHFPPGLQAGLDYSTILALHAPADTLVLSGEADFVVAPSSVVQPMVDNAAAGFSALGVPARLTHLAFPGGHTASRPKREAVYDFFATVLESPGLRGPEDGTSYKDEAALHLSVPAASKTLLDLVRAALADAMEALPAKPDATELARMQGLTRAGDLEVEALEDGFVLHSDNQPPLPFEKVVPETEVLGRLLCFADTGRAACDRIAVMLSAFGVETWKADLLSFGELEDDWPVSDPWKRLRLANYLFVTGRTLPGRQLEEILAFHDAEPDPEDGARPFYVVGVGEKAASLAILAAATLQDLDGTAAFGKPPALVDEYFGKPEFPMNSDLYPWGLLKIADEEALLKLAGRRPFMMLSPGEDADKALTALCLFFNELITLDI